MNYHFVSGRDLLQKLFNFCRNSSTPESNHQHFERGLGLPKLAAQPNVQSKINQNRFMLLSLP